MVYIIWREEHFLAIGAGTVKMGAMIGAFIGWQSGLIVAGFAISTFLLMFLLAIKWSSVKEREVYTSSSLAFATVAVGLATIFIDDLSFLSPYSHFNPRLLSPFGP